MYKKYYDILGVGFGPAGIALETAIRDDEELSGVNKYTRLFLEKNRDSAWMPEMLLPGTDVQHHFLRDFATPRNPRSEFTFSNYLFKKGRIFSFGLLGHPSRTEWSDYVQWVAKQVNHNAGYNIEVKSVEPILNNGKVDCLSIQAVDKIKKTPRAYTTKNFVLNSGRKPYIPKEFNGLLNNKIFHSCKFKSNVSEISQNGNPTFTIIGSGQNAIEIILYLASKFPDSKINSIIRHTGFRLFELGHFTNEAFFPEFTDYFYSLNQEGRDKLFEQIKHTNYSAVDNDVSESLYWKMYEDNIRGTNNIELFRCKEIFDITRSNDSFVLKIKDIFNKEQDSVNTDYIILCTGFYEEKFPEILQPIKKYLKVSQDNILMVSKDYKISTKANFNANIYLNGLSEKTHGIGDATSFTMMATKAQRIFDSLELTNSQEGYYGRK